MKIYLSGAITGTDDYMERFADMEELLVEQGHTVINPAKVNANLPTDTTWEEYMRMSILMLGMCDTIYMLKGWEKSRGANREYLWALDHNYSVMFEV